jgi:hypothetical protein
MEVREVPNDETKRTELLLESQGNYVDGLRDGEWKHGMVSHYQQREGTYENGEMVGTWMFYDAQGNPLLQQTYDEKGELLKEKYFKIKKK